VYPKSLVDCYRRRLAAIDELFNRLQKQSCSEPSSRDEISETIAAIKARNKELDRIRKQEA
jgi:hypothetical protein